MSDVEVIVANKSEDMSKQKEITEGYRKYFELIWKTARPK